MGTRVKLCIFMKRAFLSYYTSTTIPTIHRRLFADDEIVGVFFFRSFDDNNIVIQRFFFFPFTVTFPKFHSLGRLISRLEYNLRRDFGT